MRARRHLVIFLRAPALGRVKRRLARGIGDLPALKFHRDTSDKLIRAQARDRRWRVALAVTPDHARLPRAWRKHDLLSQGVGDLGRRMARVLRALPPGPAVIVGADIPDLAPRHIASAFAALGRHDAVFGPAEDGGYWLVGMARARPLPHGLFGAVRWSSAHALADTLASLPPRVRVAFVETLADVDDAAAYARITRRRRDVP